MKRKIISLIILLFTTLSYSQSKIVFTIDNPLTSITKPRYEFKDYEIPFKHASRMEGIYNGFHMIFSEKEDSKEYLNFEIMLPSNKIFYIRQLSEGAYTISDGIFPVEFTNNDFSDGVYVDRVNIYVYPIIALRKYFRESDDYYRIEYSIVFKNFSINFLNFKCQDYKVSLKAELKGSVDFSSDDYDAPYFITATIEINDEALATENVD
ncbi:MAG: hypothetical protein N2490_04870 [Ignavibacteria bacterium]|nr:hypothetical protein [Ignavibacteria bacterium]